MKTTPIIVAVALALPACRQAAESTVAVPRLEVRRDGQLVRAYSASQLSAYEPAQLTVFDPNYKRQRRYRVTALGPLLSVAYQQDPVTLRRRHFVLRSSDGYLVSIAGAQLLAGGAQVAFADLDRQDGAWERVPTGADPGPFYLVWEGATQRDTRTHPWPWALVQVDQTPHERAFGKTIPPGAPQQHAATRGYAIFARDCLRCHAINRQGGRLGPDLNVPRSIVEYRPEAQIREYIRNPLAFRYGNMPPHPHLSAGDLDDLLAYLSWMRAHKQ